MAVKPGVPLWPLLGRKAMGVPAWNIRCIITFHVIISYNNIFQYFIERSSQVNASVGIGRAVMENKLFTGISVAVKTLFIKIFSSHSLSISGSFFEVHPS